MASTTIKSCSNFEKNIQSIGSQDIRSLKMEYVELCCIIDPIIDMT